MNKALIAFFLSSLSLSALATDATNCTAAGGTLLTGVTTTAPKFAAASETLQGIKLSHTHVTLKSDANGNSYDVAMDNVYAFDYVKNSSAIPKSLAAIKVGTHLELCGDLYTSGSAGIHWVHDNCGDTPSTSDTNGWTKIVTNGVVGSNLEGSQTYCYLWN